MGFITIYEQNQGILRAIPFYKFRKTIVIQFALLIQSANANWIVSRNLFLFVVWRRNASGSNISRLVLNLKKGQHFSKLLETKDS